MSVNLCIFSPRASDLAVAWARRKSCADGRDHRGGILRPHLESPEHDYFYTRLCPDIFSTTYRITTVH